MSSPLAIGAVSAVLRNLLDNGLIDVGAPLGSVKVTAVAPDTIKLDDADAAPSLNIFLYRTSANQGWHDAGLPAYGANGTRASNPPLALDLHYLLTAYGNADLQAEILLGYAMHVLHERPVLDRTAIRTALDPSPLDASILPQELQALVASDLADQVEAVTVTPEPMDTEEMSRLWSAMQAHYRPTAGYLVSVVLIEARKPARTPLPVLSRAEVDLATERDRGVVVEPGPCLPSPPSSA
jgi:Pvc16 N-terminal domain